MGNSLLVMPTVPSSRGKRHCRERPNFGTPSPPSSLKSTDGSSCMDDVGRWIAYNAEGSPTKVLVHSLRHRRRDYNDHIALQCLFSHGVWARTLFAQGLATPTAHASVDDCYLVAGVWACGAGGAGGAAAWVQPLVENGPLARTL
jgi:hypothetical protein